MKLKIEQFAPLEMPFQIKSLFAKVKIFIFWPKTMDYSPWFEFWESKKSSEKRIPLERASQGEYNGANFSFVAPSSEELRVTILEMYAHGKGRHCSGIVECLNAHNS